MVGAYPSTSCPGVKRKRDEHLTVSFKGISPVTEFHSSGPYFSTVPPVIPVPKARKKTLACNTLRTFRFNLEQKRCSDMYHGM